MGAAEVDIEAAIRDEAGFSRDLVAALSILRVSGRTRNKPI